MLYLRESATADCFDLWSKTESAGDQPVERGLTELEVRRLFRDRAVAASRKAVTALISDLATREN